MKRHILVLLVLVAVRCGLTAAVSPSAFINFETAPVHPVDISPDGRTLAAVNLPDGRVVLFDLKEGLPIQTAELPVGIDPVSVRFRTANEVWVVNHISDSVSIIDVGRRRILATLNTLSGAADVVFAGVPQRAFVSCAKANTIQVFDPITRTALTNLLIDGERPKALAASPDGSRVYVAVFESGNGSTLVVNHSSTAEDPHGGQWPPPNRGTNLVPALVIDTNAAIEKYQTDMPRSLIVKKNAAGRWMDDNGGDWTTKLAEQRGPGWDMLDRDLAIVDTATLDIRYVTGLMNICMGIAVNPASGVISVVGTDAKNEVRFEPNLRGTFLRVNLALVDPSMLTKGIHDLNPHLSYSTSTVPQSVRDQSVGDPRGIVWNASGTRGYVTGMGSRNLVVLDANGQRVGGPIELPDGPSGLVLDEERGRLYVLNRFASTLSILDIASRNIVTNIPLFDPTPDIIRAGRKHLYDTRRNSGLGQVSCASCHVDSRFDRLAWDLGNPALNATKSPEAVIQSQHVFFHPMKGPLVTQTFQDIIGSEPLHWRGDREDIEAFNITFTDLLARDSQLTGTEMEEFKAMLATIHFPPNRFRNFDNSFPTNLTFPVPIEVEDDGDRVLATSGNARRGRDLFNAECRTCHIDQTGRGVANQEESALSLRSGVPLKVAQLRSVSEKLGGDFTSTNSRAGFGIGRDGRFDSIPAFLRGINARSRQDDLAAFLMAFTGSQVDTTLAAGKPSKDAAAAVGRQITVGSTSSNLFVNDMLALAQSPTSRVDVIAHASPTNGIQRGWFYHRGSRTFQSDRNEETVTPDQLLALAAEDSPITFTVVHRGTGRRLGVDRDDDGYFDGLEIELGYDPLNPFSRGSNSAPRIGFVAGQDGAIELYLHPGMSMSVSFAASDADVPGQTLAYSFGQEAPAGATLHPVSGAFQWTPDPSQFEQTHRFNIRVNDNGSPPFSDTRAVEVTIRSFRVLSLAFPNGPLAYMNEREILWYSVPGQSYRLEFKDRLEDSVWFNYQSVQATAPVSSAIDGSILPLPQRLYRVRWLP